MARIEISIEEYNALKDKIKELESTLVDVSKETSFYKEKYKDAESLVYDLEAEGFVGRLLKWKKVISPLVTLFQKSYEETKPHL